MILFVNAEELGEVSLHPEGPATAQLDQGFPSFSSMVE
jgi:hypothetical protein